MKDNKKPHNDVSSLATDSSLQGSNISMDSNAAHRARIARFDLLRQQSRDMSTFLFSLHDEIKELDTPTAQLMKTRLGRFAWDLRYCGNELLFKHYYKADEYRLAYMLSCKRHMLCPFCSAIRASKQANAYQAKMLQILKEKPYLKPVFITLTVKNQDDFSSVFEHLVSSFKCMQDARRKWLCRGTGFNELCKAEGFVYSIEITNKKNGWHPHLHMVALVNDWIDHSELSAEWESITGDSKIVDVRRIKPAKGTKDDYSDAFVECFKYAMKFTEMTHEQIWYVHEALSPNQRLKRLTGSVGCFRGVKVPKQLTDDELDQNSPFMLILYRFIAGSYSVAEMLDFPHGQPDKENLETVLNDYLQSGELLPRYVLVRNPETGEMTKILDFEAVSDDDEKDARTPRRRNDRLRS